MKCIVTGGSGFIGHNIVHRLAQEGNHVIVLDIVKPEYKLSEFVEYIEGDVRYYSNLYDICIDGIDEIYDCAGVLGTHELIYDNNKSVDVNINGAVNVLKVAVDCNVQRIFHPIFIKKLLHLLHKQKIISAGGRGGRIILALYQFGRDNVCFLRVRDTKKAGH